MISRNPKIEIRFAEDGYEVYPLEAFADPVTFQIVLDAGVGHKDLAFGVAGKDFDDICERNGHLTPSAPLGGAYVYSPDTSEIVEFNVGPLSLSGKGDFFFIRMWGASEFSVLDEKILGLNLKVPFEYGELFRKVV